MRATTMSPCYPFSTMSVSGNEGSVADRAVGHPRSATRNSAAAAIMAALSVQYSMAVGHRTVTCLVGRLARWLVSRSPLIDFSIMDRSSVLAETPPTR